MLTYILYNYLKIINKQWSGYRVEITVTPYINH